MSEDDAVDLWLCDRLHTKAHIRPQQCDANKARLAEATRRAAKERGGRSAAGSGESTAPGATDTAALILLKPCDGCAGVVALNHSLGREPIRYDPRRSIERPADPNYYVPREPPLPRKMIARLGKPDVALIEERQARDYNRGDVMGGSIPAGAISALQAAEEHDLSVETVRTRIKVAKLKPLGAAQLGHGRATNYYDKKAVVALLTGKKPLPGKTEPVKGTIVSRTTARLPGAPVSFDDFIAEAEAQRIEADARYEAARDRAVEAQRELAEAQLEVDRWNKAVNALQSIRSATAVTKKAEAA